MTSNQINYFKAREEQRHNVVEEGIGWFKAFIDSMNAQTSKSKVLLDYEVGSRNAAAAERNAQTNYENALINLKNAETRAFEAEIGLMNAQTNRLNAEINQRNAETRLLELEEVQRHNLASEDISYINVTESARHNQATESLEASRLMEVARHNKLSEIMEQRSMNIQENKNLMELQYKRSELAEVERHNRQNEVITLANNLARQILEQRSQDLDVYSGYIRSAISGFTSLLR